MKGLHGNGHHPQSFSRLPEFPARNRNETVPLQMIEVLLESLRGIEIILTQSHCARRRRSPGIDERHLHDIKALSCAAYE